MLPQHLHHFETEEQQREAGTFGMWLFLLTEIMFFGGLFFAYLLVSQLVLRRVRCGVEPVEHSTGRDQHGDPDLIRLFYGAGAFGLPRLGRRVCWFSS